MSRLIVKNIPKQIPESELKAHFEKMGRITDCRIMFKEKKNRRIAFIGFRKEEDALKAKEFFNNTYIYMSRINVDFAKTNDDPTLPRAWSKYSKGSASYFEKHPEEKPKNKKKEEKGKNPINTELPINSEKKAKFDEFLQLMRKTQNPSISEAMPGDELVNEKKKKKKNPKTTSSFNGNEVIVTELDQDNLKAGVSNKRIHIKLSSEINNQNIAKIIDKEQGGKKAFTIKKEEFKEKAEEKLDEKRLYVVNLPFDSNDEEIREIFQKYGKITELKLPKGKEGKFKGFAYVSYENENQALHAFSELDNKIVMGRILHLRPAYEDNKKNIENVNDFGQFSDEKTSYKKSKKVVFFLNLNLFFFLSKIFFFNFKKKQKI